jgi:hypothetical protein
MATDSHRILLLSHSPCFCVPTQALQLPPVVFNGPALPRFTMEPGDEAAATLTEQLAHTTEGGCIWTNGDVGGQLESSRPRGGR